MNRTRNTGWKIGCVDRKPTEEQAETVKTVSMAGEPF